MVFVSIEITDGKMVFKGGDVIIGNVVVECSKPTEFIKVELTCKGSAKVVWVEGSAKNPRTHIGKQLFFSDTSKLMTSSGQEIPTGRNLYPFRYKLPTDLPSSFESPEPFGYIRYRLQARLQQTRVKNKRCQLFFTVLEEVDLNNIPNAALPSATEDSQTICCLCCASGMIELRVSCDKTGVVPGEFVIVNASVNNGSNYNLSNCKVRIIQTIVLHAKSKKLKVKIDLTKGLVAGIVCPKQTSISLNSHALQLPAVVSSHLRFCKIIDVEYFVEFVCNTPGGIFEKVIKTPLEVGTIPLRRGSGQISSTNGTTNMSPTEYSVPVPSYVAGTTGTVLTSKYNFKVVKFAPQYIYYDWRQHLPQ